MTESIEKTRLLDIAIIGGGPGGLSAAHALVNQGLSVGIFERARALRPIGAALGLAQQGYQALSDINPQLSTRVRSLSANPQRQLLMRPNGEVLFLDESPMAGTSFTWVGWHTLQTCLRDCLPDSVHLYLNHKLIHFTTSDGADRLVRLKFQNQSEYLAKVLVGADGYNSAVRNATVQDGKPLYTGTMTWRGIVPRQAMMPLNTSRLSIKQS
ncbi:FAD-dependent monooxygenase [Pleurocapsa sp. FMAR1]|uniref:FAD-dependent monooxygenase n=1 Tax=Pleurocapsa sp. FMAR1 TaxID=3040204 RepID=UPI0029C81996|nr:FAD-dependent monooxygenase [Pleurocapsa sp. FMAR1]